MSVVCKPPGQSIIGCYGGRAKTSSRMLGSRTCRDLIIQTAFTDKANSAKLGFSGGREMGRRTLRSVEAAFGSGSLIGSVIRQWGVAVLAGVAFCVCLLPSSAVSLRVDTVVMAWPGPSLTKEQACASSGASLRAALEPESGTEYNKKDRRVGSRGSRILSEQTVPP